MFGKKSKKFFALILACLLACALVLPAYADGSASSDDAPINYRWTNVKYVKWTHSIVGSKLKLTAEVLGYSGTTYSNGVMQLRNSSNSLIGTWSGISSSNSSFTINNYLSYVPPSGTYTATLTITATRSGVSEIVTSSYTFTI